MYVNDNSWAKNLRQFPLKPLVGCGLQLSDPPNQQSDEDRFVTSSSLTEKAQSLSWQVTVHAVLSNRNRSNDCRFGAIKGQRFPHRCASSKRSVFGFVSEPRTGLLSPSVLLGFPSEACLPVPPGSHSPASDPPAEMRCSLPSLEPTLQPADFLRGRCPPLAKADAFVQTPWRFFHARPVLTGTGDEGSLLPKQRPKLAPHRAFQEYHNEADTYMGNTYTYVALQQTFASPNVYLVNRHQQSGAVSPTKADPNLPHNVGVKRLLWRGQQAGSLLGHGPAHRNGCARFAFPWQASALVLQKQLQCVKFLAAGMRSEHQDNQPDPLSSPQYFAISGERC
ncbi:hypothetical protein Anapl_12663 [Anas platyrhynchos]|uniref:Uncharacterized protein n=1 Tax=Anas platyrhynchos TaxID=8839 RepID=R0M549_ANAPL|nr:hypothetical protein Anapl_12663 [Anas platyrhynchos]